MTNNDAETVGNSSLPLCVDLDGTLILTDSLWETLLRLLASKPWMAFIIPFWLLRGKAGFKQRLSEYQPLDTASLPYNAALLKYLTQQRLQNRHIVLVTAANHGIADAIAAHLNIFDEVLASDAQHNLSGHNKGRRLSEKFGEKGFVYAANAPVDLHVWQHAAAAVLVNTSPSLSEKAEQLFNIEKILPAENTATIRTWLRAIRVHQWAKNILIFAPLLLAHAWHDPELLLIALMAFFAFSFSASAIYLFNDLMDLEADRAHASKRHRPLAAGTLSIPQGIALIPVLLLAAFVLAFFINTTFITVLLLYLVLTTAYSLFLKPLALLDVLTLTGLYTMRIIAGAIATGVELSYWLVAFSLFIFLSLALIKRYSELQNLLQQKDGKSTARGYHVDDLSAVSLFGISSGFISIMVLVLYIHDLQADSLYSNPDWLWLVSVSILFWIMHMWLLALRGKMNEDPILFAIHDRPSYVVALLTALGILLAI